MTHRSIHRPASLSGLALLLMLPLGGVLGSSQVASATAPCGAISLADGRVVLERPLAAALPLSESASACARAIGEELHSLQTVRSVQVSIRVPDNARHAGSAIEVAEALASALSQGGIARHRIATVAPRVVHGEPTGAAITFRAKGKVRSVASLRDVWGDVSMGRSLRSLRAAEVGMTVADGSWVRTGALGVAVLALVDGSSVRLGAGTSVQVGPVHRDAEGRRHVELDLERGELSLEVTRRGAGSTFDIMTRSAVAGVRGTAFRIVADEQDRTRLETSTGLVELAAAGASVDVGAAEGSRVAAGSPPEAPRSLLAGPRVLAPLMGTAASDTRLTWQADRGARSYRVELSRDADFVADYSRFDVPRSELVVGSANLASGKWFWRVASVDSDGFVGLPSRVHAFTNGG